jgi:hypothetical protein
MITGYGLFMFSEISSSFISRTCSHDICYIFSSYNCIRENTYAVHFISGIIIS